MNKTENNAFINLVANAFTFVIVYEVTKNIPI